MARTRPSRDRRLALLLGATALAYAIGYPLALVGHSAVGWFFVALGGPLLIAVGFVLVRRLHASAQSPAPLADRTYEP